MSKIDFGKTAVLLRRAIKATPDGSGVETVLAGLSDGGVGWLTGAYAELRRRLIRAETREARLLAQLIETTKHHVDARLSRDTGAFSLSTVESLISGIHALVVNHDSFGAIDYLMPLTVSTRYEESLRWAAWVWTSAASATAGQIAQAKTAADTALTIAGQIDAYAKAVSLAVRSTLGTGDQNLRGVLRRLAEAAGVLDDAGHRREVSCLWLLHARFLAAIGNERAALRAAGQAADSDPEWLAPAVFLARRAIASSQMAEAKRLLAAHQTNERYASDIERELRLVSGIEAGRIPRSLALEYFWIAERLPTEEAEQQLLELIDDNHDCWLLCESIAWDLVAEGSARVAESLFLRLIDGAVSDEVKVSAERGLQLVQQGGGIPLVLGPLQYMKRCVVEESSELMSHDDSFRSSAAGFWVRRAVEAGQVDVAYDMLAMLDTAEVPAEEYALEKQFVEAIAHGFIPLSAASEFVWVRERPTTDDVGVQLRELASEYEGVHALRAVIAWDLALDGMTRDAVVLFRELSEREDLGDALRNFVSHGLEYAEANIHRDRGSVPDRENGGTNTRLGLSRFVWTKQQWPSVLDSRPLLFVGETNALPEQMLAVARETTVAQGQHIHSQGKEGQLLYCLIDGQATASRARGAIHDVATITSGQYFGELGTLCGLPNTASVVADTRSSLLTVERQILQKHMQFDRQGSAPVLLNKFKQIYLSAVLALSPLRLSGSTAESGGGDILQQRGMSTWRTYQKGEVVVARGKSVTPALVVYGLARVSYPRNENADSVGFLCPGDVLGEFDVSPVTVQAENTLTTVSIERGLFDELAQDKEGALHKRLEACQAFVDQSEQ